MNIAIIGYGKMGKAIEEIAIEMGHTITATLNEKPSPENIGKPDVAIEFSTPETALDNVKACLQMGIPVVCGTTGWLEHRKEVENVAVENKTAFLYGSNFSLGVNIFYELNKKLASLMKNIPEYTCQLEEIHHTEKKDAPSGTALSLAEHIIKTEKYSSWKADETQDKEVGIFSRRVEGIPGTHSVIYTSLVDEIEIKHTAYNRKGFAMGAVLAAQWVKGKVGNFGMRDVLGFK